MKASTHLAHGTCKAARGGREGKSSLVRGTRTRLGEGEFLRKKSLYYYVQASREELSTVCVLTEIRASGALKARSYRCYCRVTDGFGHYQDNALSCHA